MPAALQPHCQGAVCVPLRLLLLSVDVAVLPLLLLEVVAMVMMTLVVAGAAVLLPAAWPALRWCVMPPLPPQPLGRGERRGRVPLHAAGYTPPDLRTASACEAVSTEHAVRRSIGQQDHFIDSETPCKGAVQKFQGAGEGVGNSQGACALRGCAWLHYRRVQHAVLWTLCKLAISWAMCQLIPTTHGVRHPGTASHLGGCP